MKYAKTYENFLNELKRSRDRRVFKHKIINCMGNHMDSTTPLNIYFEKSE